MLNSAAIILLVVFTTTYTPFSRSFAKNPDTHLGVWIFCIYSEGTRTEGSISDAPRVQAQATDDWLGGTYACEHSESLSLPVYQKRSNFCLPKVTYFLSNPQAWQIIIARSVVHIISPFGAVSHHAPACILLRLDEMQHFVLMICNSFEIDEIQGFALICMQESDIICSKNKNL